MSRILIVDDERALTALLESRLRAKGHEVWTAAVQELIHEQLEEIRGAAPMFFTRRRAGHLWRTHWRGCREIIKKRIADKKQS